MYLIYYTFGLISGCFITLWINYLIGKHEKWADTTQRSIIRDHFTEKPPKPDLKKVKYYQSPEYKVQKAFIERMKKGDVE